MSDPLTDVLARLDELDSAIDELRQAGRDYAEAERDYKIALRVNVLKLRKEGYAVGVIDKMCYGVEEVAEKRFARDCAEMLYKASQEAINSKKLRIRIINEWAAREWGR